MRKMIKFVLILGLLLNGYVLSFADGQKVGDGGYLPVKMLFESKDKLRVPAQWAQLHILRLEKAEKKYLLVMMQAKNIPQLPVIEELTPNKISRFLKLLLMAKNLKFQKNQRPYKMLGNITFGVYSLTVMQTQAKKNLRILAITFYQGKAAASFEKMKEAKPIITALLENEKIDKLIWLVKKISMYKQSS